MSLEWLAANRAPLARSGVLCAELVEQALAEAGIPTPQDAELEPLLRRFWQHQQIAAERRALWLAQRDLSLAELPAIVSRQHRWQQWCEQRWGDRLETLFLRHKNQLDRARASVLRLENGELARELYLRLQEGESGFETLARQYCGDDQPQRQGGVWGPKPLSTLPPLLAELMRNSPVGQLRGPERIGTRDWVVLRVESFIGSRLDDPALKPRLLEMEGERWLEEQMQRWLQDRVSSG